MWVRILGPFSLRKAAGALRLVGFRQRALYCQPCCMRSGHSAASAWRDLESRFGRDGRGLLGGSGALGFAVMQRKGFRLCTRVPRAGRRAPGC
jgi:hypothetical protein